MSLFPELSFRLEIVEELGSTNQALLDQSHLDNFHGRALLAKRQLAGVGRRGRSWQSLEGNLALSIGFVLKKDQPISLLPFIVGISLYDTALEYLPTGADLSLKWPNDIYLNKKKMGGMLSQAKQQGDEIRFVVGIGLNLLEAPVEARVPAIALAAMVQAPPSAEAFAEKFLRHLSSRISNITEFEQLRADWETRCKHMGKEILYFSPDTPEQKIRALAKSISATGELRVEQLDGTESSLSGEELSLELLL